MAGRYTPPILEASGHDLDAVTPLVAPLVVFHDLLALFAAWNAGTSPFVLQRFPEPVSVMAPVPEQPIYFGRLDRSACAPM